MIKQPGLGTTLTSYDNNMFPLKFQTLSQKNFVQILMSLLSAFQKLRMCLVNKTNFVLILFLTDASERLFERLVLTVESLPVSI